MKELQIRQHFLVALFALCVLGCGDGRPSRVPVSGQVFIDGEPLKFGFIRFVPVGNRPSKGKLDENGRFILGCFEPDDGAVVGLHRVEVAACEPINSTQVKWHAPKKYSAYNDSGLQNEVTGPTDSVRIELSWDGGRPFVETDSAGDEEASPRKKLAK